MASPSSSGLTLQDLLQACLRRWPVVMLITTLVTIGAFGTAIRVTPLFEATTSLVLANEGAAISPLAKSLLGAGDDLLLTERDRLVSHPVLSDALDRCQARKRFPYRDAVYPERLLAQRLDAAASRYSTVIRVSLVDEDADQARELLSAVLSAYFALRAETTSELTDQRLAFLREQLHDLASEESLARTAITEFRTRHQLLATNPDTNHLSSRLQQLITKQADHQATRAASSALLAQYDQALAASAADGTNDLAPLLRITAIQSHPLVTQRLNNLARQQDALDQVGQRFGPKHPRFRSAQRTVDLAQDHLREAVDLAGQAIRSAQRAHEIQAHNLAEDIAAASHELSTYQAKLIELDTLTQEARRIQDLHQDLARLAHESEITSRSEARVLDVIDPPRATAVPINIRKKLFLAVSMLLGLLAGGSVAILLELRDRRPRDLRLHGEQIGLTTLASIPYEGQLHRRLPTAMELTSTAIEAFHSLASQLLINESGEQQSLVLTCTSPEVGAGKTTVCTHLARALATAGKRVLLIDADLRRPSLHQRFGIALGPGLAQIIRAYEDLPSVATDLPSLQVLPAGEQLTDPLGLLHRPSLHHVISRCERSFDIIIIDTPPAGLFADSLPLASMSDLVLLVVREGQTTRDQIDAARTCLAPVADRIAGQVINAARGLPTGSQSYV